MSVLTRHQIRISMDGKGCWRDNVFVERLWKSIKYEKVYLHAYDSVSAARTGIARYLTFYNTRRPHTALDRRPPDAVYFDSCPSRRQHETRRAPLISTADTVRKSGATSYRSYWHES